MDGGMIESEKPAWNELYSVAAATWNNHVWVDLSLLFNCTEKVGRVATYLDNSGVISCMFHWDTEHFLCRHDSPEMDKYVHRINADNGLLEHWREWRRKATEYWERYNKWQKIYGNKSA